MLLQMAGLGWSRALNDTSKLGPKKKKKGVNSLNLLISNREMKTCSSRCKRERPDPTIAQQGQVANAHGVAGKM